MAKARGSAPKPATKSDAYVGLLFISLLAQIAGVVFFYLDWSAYPEKEPPRLAAPFTPGDPPGGAGGAGGAAAGAAGAGGMAGMAGAGGGAPVGGAMGAAGAMGGAAMGMPK